MLKQILPAVIFMVTSGLICPDLFGPDWAGQVWTKQVWAGQPEARQTDDNQTDNGQVKVGQGFSNLPRTIRQVKKSIVGIGTYKKIRRPPAIIRATGFAVLDGNHIVSNFHVLPEKIDTAHREIIAIFTTGGGDEARIIQADVVVKDEEHDLCLLSFKGKALPPPYHGQRRPGSGG